MTTSEIYDALIADAERVTGCRSTENTSRVLGVIATRLACILEYATNSKTQDIAFFRKSLAQLSGIEALNVPTNALD